MIMMDVSSQSKGSTAFSSSPVVGGDGDLQNEGATGRASSSSATKCLNRFLTKTYQMTNSRSPDCKSVMWCPNDNGRSFIIVDVEEFSSKVLPKFFKHSKLSSFVRQLNFYGFRKMRSERSSAAATAAVNNDDDDDSSVSSRSDEEDMDGEGENKMATGSKNNKTGTGNNNKGMTVRFYHEYFRAGRPDLLHKIQRATKSAEPPNPSHVENLKEQVETMKEQLNAMTADFDSKLLKMKVAIELHYDRRIAQVENNYKDLLSIIVRERFPLQSQSAGDSTAGVAPGNSISQSADGSAGSAAAGGAICSPMSSSVNSSSHASSLLALRAAAVASGGDHFFSRPAHLGLGFGGPQLHQEELLRQRELLSSISVPAGHRAFGMMGLGGSGYVADVFGHSLPSASSAVSRMLVNGAMGGAGPFNGAGNEPPTAAELGLSGMLGKYRHNP